MATLLFLLELAAFVVVIVWTYGEPSGGKGLLAMLDDGQNPPHRPDRAPRWKRSVSLAPRRPLGNGVIRRARFLSAAWKGRPGANREPSR